MSAINGGFRQAKPSQEQRISKKPRLHNGSPPPTPSLPKPSPSIQQGPYDGWGTSPDPSQVPKPTLPPKK